MTKTMKNRYTKFYPISLYRRGLSPKGIEKAIADGAIGFDTFEDANEYLWKMDTDDCDYDVCHYEDGKWYRVRKNGFRHLIT